MIFLTIDSLKSQLGCTSINIVKNPKENGKLFAETNNNIKLKVQQDIDLSLNIKFMHKDDEPVTNGCLINAKENTENVLVVL